MSFSCEREGSKAKRARGRIALPGVGLPPLGRLGGFRFLLRDWDVCKVETKTSQVDFIRSSDESRLTNPAFLLGIALKMKPKVFISAGTATTRTQADAVDAIFRSLEAAGLAARQMERNEWTAEQPLRGIKRVISECDGAVVIAYTRYSFPSGLERQKNGGEKQLADVCITTVWNQIEAAIAYTKDLPLLVIAENGLLSDGLLEGRYDWKVYWTDFTPEQLRSDAFLGYLESWKRLVTTSGNRRKTGSDSDAGLSDVSKISIAQLIGHLTVPQIWTVVSTLLATLAAAATGGYRIGGGHWPWPLP